MYYHCTYLGLHLFEFEEKLALGFKTCSNDFGWRKTTVIERFEIILDSFEIILDITVLRCVCLGRYSLGAGPRHEDSYFDIYGECDFYYDKCTRSTRITAKFCNTLQELNSRIPQKHENDMASIGDAGDTGNGETSAGSSRTGNTNPMALTAIFSENTAGASTSLAPPDDSDDARQRGASVSSWTPWCPNRKESLDLQSQM
ncbi:hypothetical protein K491DRAFT_682608 [Lophiostoma macrostomum CBS 122681]|uniref:Uncharacterized protein n=1 Tax=Lophiostoma macrostomum CBS 122681 TaxID=1314788 RepID=A0A6A6STI0_9PLEO|nr:hypothetical protein K491DRAFT_682608 [Lophiostoma macrostomum CBS 122681]